MITVGPCGIKVSYISFLSINKPARGRVDLTRRFIILETNTYMFIPTHKCC